MTCGSVLPAGDPTVCADVEDLRPRGGLLGRDAELAELRAFVHPVGAEGGPPYADWVAEAWAGKTALAAQFASDPPPGADVVSFFAPGPASGAERRVLERRLRPARRPAQRAAAAGSPTRRRSGRCGSGRRRTPS